MFTIVMIFYNLFAVIDTILMATRWKYWADNPRTNENWPANFQWIDWILATVLFINCESSD